MEPQYLRRELKNYEFLKCLDVGVCWFLAGTYPTRDVIVAFKPPLAMASPVFKDLFYSPIDRTPSPIYITDMEPEDFRAMLGYIYTNNVDITAMGQARNLYFGARKYLLTHLKRKCEVYLTSQLRANNDLQIYEFVEMF